MASPRLFVSSTCYDLHEIRFQLRNFIADFGYEPVLSEFDDIFYSYEAHVQDACMNEIDKCQLFILVIGNNYGSFYHQDNSTHRQPDSVTMKEFKTAISANVAKHIFINKFVDYDYKNYKRALDKVFTRHFDAVDVPDDQVTEVKRAVKANFDETYPFPYESYRYIFYFIDEIYSLKVNNAVLPFETFDDIKNSLRKQWAGFIYESLTRKNEKQDVQLASLDAKFEKLNRSITKMLESSSKQENGESKIDLSSLLRDTNLDSLEAVQNEIEFILFQLLKYYDGYNNEGLRATFEDEFTVQTTSEWLESLEKLLRTFKWSKEIDFQTVFEGKRLSYATGDLNIPYKTVLRIYSIYNSLQGDDKEGFVNTVCQALNKSHVPVKKGESRSRVTTDDLPF